jgi:hypothetical protein
MKCLLTCVAAIMICALAGCQSTKTTVMSLSSQDDAQTPLNQTMKVTEKGTYYLYSSKDSNTAVYHIDLKKGDELGFHASGNRAQGLAKGVLIELSEYSEGASYTWKHEEKPKD